MRPVVHMFDPGRVSALGKVGDWGDPHLPGKRAYKNDSSTQNQGAVAPADILLAPVEREINSFDIVCIGFVYVVALITKVFLASSKPAQTNVK